MSRSADIVVARITFWLLVPMALGTLVVMVLYGVNKFLQGFYMEGGITLFGAVGIFLTYHRLGSQIRLHIREFRREQAVVYGQSMAPLARPQPEPVSQATIAEPIVIRLREDWRFMAFLILLTLLVFVFFAGVSISAGEEVYWRSGFGFFTLLLPLACSHWR
jgi:hypothetical protein